MIKTRLLDPDHGLPFMVEYGPSDRLPGRALLISWYKENERYVDQKLLEHGAILFRGFNINTPSAFARFARSVTPALMSSIQSNSPRTKLTAGIYTSTEYPAEYQLSMHSEYAYSHKYPARLFFCCVVEPERGGETPIADNRKILKRLDSSIVEEFKRKQVSYLRNLHGGNGFGLSWQSTFQTTDRSVVEQHCRDLSIDLEWKTDGGLRLRHTFDAVVTHRRTGEQAWFNQAPQFHPSDYPTEIYESLLSLYKGRETELPENACFGDNSPIDMSVLRHIRETMYKQAAVFPWREGDVMMLDNVLTCHGRMPFFGQRKILLAMSEK
jgi:alpha-ketoglutarate-dependent taurine dioxygenase